MYQLVTKIGSGSTSDVYLARVPERLLVVKQIRSDVVHAPGYLETLERERSVAMTFTHSRAVRIFDIQKNDDEGITVAMEWVHGQTLAQVLHRAAMRGEKLPARTLVWIAVQAAQALYAAHKTPWADGEQSPILHGGISPHEILISYTGEVKVLGIGLGRSDLCLPASISTLAYRAPELVERTGTDRRADIYSLGLVIYDAISGQRVFKRRSPEETEAAVLAHEMPPFAEVAGQVSEQLVSVVDAMTRRKRGERPQSMSQVVAALAGEHGQDVNMALDVAMRVSALFVEEKNTSEKFVDGLSRRSIPKSPTIEFEAPVDTTDHEPEDAVDHGPASVTAGLAQKPSYPADGIELLDDDGSDGDMSIVPAFEFLNDASQAMKAPIASQALAQDLIDDVLRMSTGEHDISQYMEESPRLQAAAAQPPMPVRSDSGLKAFPPPGYVPEPADIGQIALDLFAELSEDTSKQK